MVDAAQRPVVGSEAASSQERPPRKERVLALEIRLSKFGFVVFEGPTKLLDWGVKSYAGRGALRRAILEKKIRPLLDLYALPTVVMRRRISSSRKARTTIRSVIRTVKRITRSRSAPLQLISTRVIRSRFVDHGCTTKEQIASLIATRFAELSWKLPPKRKSWQREAYTMPIFDAAATGIAFFDRRGRRGRDIGSRWSSD